MGESILVTNSWGILGNLLTVPAGSVREVTKQRDGQ